jgi:hypothetical protein
VRMLKKAIAITALVQIVAMAGPCTPERDATVDARMPAVPTFYPTLPTLPVRGMTHLALTRMEKVHYLTRRR